MKVIFIKDLKNQGRRDEIKEVSDGYGNNFLIKNGYAVVYNQSNKTKLDSQNEKKAISDKKNYEEALLLKSNLEQIQIKFKVKTGLGDKVFGNITTKQISEELKKHGFNIDKKIIKSPSISCLGFHEISIELRKDAVAKFNIQLEK